MRRSSTLLAVTAGALAATALAGGVALATTPPAATARSRGQQGPAGPAGPKGAPGPWVWAIATDQPLRTT